MLTPQPLSTMSLKPPFPLSRLHSLVATAMAMGFLGLGGGVAAAGGSGPPNGCVTLQGTALTRLTRMTDSEDVLLWQCLRIIKNGSLETIDLSKLTGLTYLEIKDNEGLNDIRFPSSLKYLYIKNNDDDELRSLNLSNLTRLTHLRIEDNKCPSSITFPNLSNLEYLHIINNDQLKITEDTDSFKLKMKSLTHLNIADNDRLEKIKLENLVRLGCLDIKDNKILESIFAPNLVDSYCIKVSNNSSLESINFSKLINVTHLKIEDNKKLTTITAPSHFLGTGPP